MEKIGVKEFKGMTDTKKTNILTHNALDFEYKEYLSIEEKISLCKTIINSTFYDSKNQYIGFDTFRFEIAKTYCFIKDYITNISFPQKKNEDGKMEDDIIQSFDIISCSNLFGALNNAIRLELMTVDQLLNNAVTDMIERHRISANDNMADLIDILKRKEEEELINMKLTNKQMELTLNMMPDNPEDAEKMVANMTKGIDDLSKLPNFQTIQAVMAKEEKGQKLQAMKEVDKDGDNT